MAEVSVKVTLRVMVNCEGGADQQPLKTAIEYAENEAGRKAKELLSQNRDGYATIDELKYGNCTFWNEPEV